MPASGIFIRCPQDAGVVPHRVHVVPHSVEMQIGRVPEAMTQLSAGYHGGWDGEKKKKATR